MNFDDFKHKALDFVDAVRADPKKLNLAIGVVAFILGFAFAKFF